MVDKIIRDYIEGGAKKLTVPGFGTFMRREGGEVIFVDLLRGDDHTLSEMVEDSGGYSELEAMALIDRFIFKTRDAIERTGSAVIEGFGTMTLDHKGAYQFRYSPKSKPVKEHAVQERLFEEKPPRRQQPAVEPPPVRQAEIVPKSAAVPARRNAGPGKPAHRPQAGKPRRKEPQGAKHSRADIILIVAIIAAALAVVAMVFAFRAGNMPFLSK